MKQAVLIFFICISFAARTQTPFAHVRNSLLIGNFANALVVLDSCADKNYFSDSVLYYKGMTYLKKGELKYAKKTTSILLKSYPAFSEAHYLNALVQYSDENFGKSIDEFNMALKSNPKNIKALFNRSLAFGVLEDYLSAIEDLSTCIELNPNYALAYYSRGYWYEFTGNYNEAAKDYENSIRLDPANYDAYYGLAFIYQNQKETDKACEILTRATYQGSQIAEELKNNYCR